MSENTFRKEERLCNKKIISQLYESTHRFVAFPLSVYWMAVSSTEMSARMQVLIVVPKRRLRHAVDRNRTKRMMRECWRQRKRELLRHLEIEGKNMVVGISYIHNTPADYKKLEKSFDVVVSKLLAEGGAENQ